MIGRNHVRRIDLDILRENVRAIRSAVPETARLLAVVKADAYGHGMVQTAKTALESGADWLAVAITEEGAALRRAGIDAPTLVLGAATPGSALQGVACGLTLSVCSPAMIGYLQTAAEKTGRRAYAHIKLDTGMSRIGCRTAEEVTAVYEAIQAAPDVELTGVFTHFADADGDTPDFTLRQFARFQELASLLPKNIIRHCANSAALDRYPEMALDMVRAGIVMYGYPPVESLIPVRPFMTWETEVTYVKTVDPGDTVSYGRTWMAAEPRRVATVAVGYGDGYHRAITGKGSVLIRGKRVPIIGRVCMDQILVDVTDIPETVPGDCVVLMGEMGDERITAEDLAAWAGTISYEILLAATGRVRRQWLHAENDCTLNEPETAEDAE